MAVEAAMLGTPSLRFNDFAGKIGVLEELEHKYELTFAIPPSEISQQQTFQPVISNKMKVKTRYAISPFFTKSKKQS